MSTLLLAAVGGTRGKTSTVGGNDMLALMSLILDHVGSGIGRSICLWRSGYVLALAADHLVYIPDQSVK